MTRLQSGAQVHDLRILHVLGKEPWGQNYRVQNETGEQFELLAFVDEAPSPEAKNRDVRRQQVAALAQNLQEKSVESLGRLRG